MSNLMFLLEVMLGKILLRTLGNFSGVNIYLKFPVILSCFPQFP